MIKNSKYIKFEYSMISTLNSCYSLHKSKKKQTEADET